MWCILVQLGASWCILGQFGAFESILLRSWGGLPGTSGEVVWEVRESPGELSQGPPGRGGGELSGGVPGSSPWDLGGGGLGAPGESQGELKMESKWSLKWRLKVGSPRTLKMWISIRS